MKTEAIFNGVRNGFIFFYDFQNKVAQEIGKERALELDAASSRELGAAQGMLLKEQTGQDIPDAISASNIIMKYLEQELGVRMVVKDESPERVVYSCGRCPIFEANQVLGTDSKDIEFTCRAVLPL